MLGPTGAGAGGGPGLGGLEFPDESEDGGEGGGVSKRTLREEPRLNPRTGVAGSDAVGSPRSGGGSSPPAVSNPEKEVSAGSSSYRLDPPRRTVTLAERDLLEGEDSLGNRE